MMVALKHCLHGSRRQIYENVLKANKKVEGTDENKYWGQVYRQIRERLFKFLETPLERQLRVDGEWSAFYKTKGMTALQFEAEWERLHAELVEVGLGKGKLDKFLAYLKKVGPGVSETIRLDRRPRSDGSGGLTTRLPDSWEECHQVLCELEGVKAGSRAFQSARAAPQQPVDSQPFVGAVGNGKKGDKGAGKGKKDKSDQPCFEWRDKGTCSRGDNCKFSHDVSVTGRHPSGALSKAAKAKAKAKAAAAKAQGQDQAGPFKGKGGGKGNPSPKAKAKPKAKSAKDKKKTLCKFVKQGKECPAGNSCEYNHKHWLFDANGKWVGKAAGKSRGRGGGRGCLLYTSPSPRDRG